MTLAAKPAPAAPSTQAPPSTPAPDTRQIEAQEWAQITGSANPDDFDAFVRNHPSSPRLEQARSRASELRQMRARAAQEAEQTVWEKVDQRNQEQLEDYLSRFPSGAHAAEASVRIAEAGRQAAEALAAQSAREQKEQEQAKRAADQQAILKVIMDFEAAYNRRDLMALQRIWSTLQVGTYRNQFRDAKDLTFQLRIVGQPDVNGGTAVAMCTRTISYRGQSGGPQHSSERVRVTLTRESPGWLIRSIESK